jgi:hypothetical protein
MEDFGLFPSAPPLLLRMEISTSVKLAVEPVRLRPDCRRRCLSGKILLKSFGARSTDPNDERRKT